MREQASTQHMRRCLELKKFGKLSKHSFPNKLPSLWGCAASNWCFL